MIVVELIASIPPKKMQSIRSHPKEWPTSIPSPIIQKMMVQAEMTGAIPILSIFLMEKSSPKENNRKITPMSAQVCTLERSITDIV